LPGPLSVPDYSDEQEIRDIEGKEPWLQNPRALSFTNAGQMAGAAGSSQLTSVGAAFTWGISSG